MQKSRVDDIMSSKPSGTLGTSYRSIDQALIENQLSVDILHNLPVAVYTCDPLGYITSFNKAAAKLWGRSPIIGEDLWCGSWKIFTPNGEPLSLDACPMARALREGIVIEGEEVIVQRPDGTKINVLPYPVPKFNDKGVLTGAINTLIDITEQKNRQDEQAMLAAIIESSEDAIISKNLDGIITSWNRSAEQIFGYKSGEVLGRSILFLIPEERQEEETLIIGKIKKGEKVDHFETYRLTKNGLKIPVSLTISPIKDPNGVVIGASKIVRDISRQKTFEAKLHRYTENLEIINTIGRVVSGSLDLKTILQNVTDATTQLTGAGFGAFFYNKLDENGESYMLYTLSGAPREAFEKFGMPRNTAVFHPTFSGEQIIRVDDITKDSRYGKNDPHFGMPEGHLPVVSYLAVPVISKNGSVIGGLFFGHPEPGKFTVEHEKLVMGVSSQASVALDNAMLYEEISKLNLKKDEFIGMASHELKTPITSLSGYLQIMDKTVADTDHNKPYIQKARRQIKKLSDLISDLLDVSKIETGKLPLSFSDFDLLQLMEEVIDIMQYSAQTHHIELNCDLDHLNVLADKQRIEQVLINLVSNAIKYSPKADSVKVSVSAFNNKAIVSVQDFGIGIHKGQQERIFSRFYRVEDLASHISGLGIGLYISKEIITRHSGKLSVVSEPRKGSVFTFEIPIKKDGSH